MSLVFLALLSSGLSASSVQAQDRSISHFEPSASTFCSERSPNRRVTRAMMAQIRGSSMNLSQFQPVKIADVPKSHPAYWQIQKAIAIGWMGFVSKNRFLPEYELRRDEGFAILMQTTGISKNSVAKRPKKWSDPLFQLAKERGIVNTDNRGDRPNAPMLQQDFCYGLKKLGLIPLPTKSPSVPLPTKSPVLSGDQDNPTPPWFTSPWAMAGLAGTAFIVGGFFLRFRKPPKRTTFLDSLVSPIPLPDPVEYLLVTEECSRGKQDGIRIADEKIRTFPASFGNWDCTYAVKSLPNVEGKIFEIVKSHGNLYLMPQPQKTLTCNGIPVPPQGLPLDKHTPSRIQYQHVSWRLQLLRDLPTKNPSPTYFVQ